MKHIAHKLAAFATVTAASLLGVSEASAAVGFEKVMNNVSDSADALPTAINMTAYIGGTGLGVAGVFKLKQHVDNPGQVAMKDGLIRLGAGGGLLALPAITTAMKETIQGTTASTSNGVKNIGGTDVFKN